MKTPINTNSLKWSRVFVWPDPMELDVISKIGLLLVCGLKSLDKAGLYVLERKARYHKVRHRYQAIWLMVNSLISDARVRQVAERLDIETYGDSINVEAL